MLKKYKKVEHILIGISLITFTCVVTTIFTIHFNQSLNTRVLVQTHQIKEIAKDIIYHDEVLTMSARVNIMDNQPHWFERYQKHSLLLDQTLENAQSNNIPIDELIAKLKITNESLISMESAAFELVTMNKYTQAKNVLFGEKYTNTKLKYTQTIEAIVSQIKSFEQALVSDYRLRETLLFRLFVAVTISFLLLVSLTYIVKRIKDKQIDALVLNDPLTSLLNRRSFDVALPHEFSRCKREQRILGVAILDVDNFKRFNDLYGHVAGDNALIQIGSALNDVTRRATEFAYRIGGEEFALILSISEISEAENIVANILSSIQQLKIKHEGNPPYDAVTISIGLVTMAPETDMTPNEVHTKADDALYYVKSQGRNAVKSVQL